MNKYIYEKGDIEIAKNQCEFCRFNGKDKFSSCDQYEIKPQEILLNLQLCRFYKDIHPLPWEEEETADNDDACGG